MFIYIVEAAMKVEGKLLEKLLKLFYLLYYIGNHVILSF